MNEHRAPERRNLWKWLLLAAAVALVLLFTVVLPAEYGYDPTRVGRLLGVTELKGERSDTRGGLDEVIEDLLSANENLEVKPGSDPMDPIALPNPAISQIEAGAPRTETLRVRLDFDERTELKAEMRKHKAILYNWKVEGGEVYVDFHGHDPAKSDAFWVRYEEAGQEQGEGVRERHGSLVAPFDGQHGWYFLNISDGPITIELTVTGYFERLVDLGLLK